MQEALQGVQPAARADPGGLSGSASQWHSLGVEAARGGRWGDAAKLVSAAVEKDSSLPEFHCDLGFILSHLGRFEEAVESCRRALALKPDMAAAHHNLGVALKAQGKFQEVVACCQRVLALEPRHCGALNNLGLALKITGNAEEAMACWQKAIELQPRFFKAHINLGDAFIDREQPEAALASFRCALEIEPNSAEAHHRLGEALCKLRQYDEAVLCFQRALEINPGRAPVHSSLGTALAAQKRFEEAVAFFSRALELQPSFAPAHHNLGHALAEQSKFNEAIACYRRALELEPDPNTFSNLATALKDRARQDPAQTPNGFEEAVACYRRCLELKPNFADAHVNLALLLLLIGDFEQGWREYEWRNETPGFPLQEGAKPLWKGEPLTGKTILLSIEQGLGDTLQFVRFAPLVKKLGATVALICQPELVGLLRRCPGIDRLVSATEPPPDFDVRVWLLSLPGILGINLWNIPTQIPYLFPPPSALDIWEKRLSPVAGLKVGIAWQGNPEHRGDRHRSIPLVAFEPIARCPAVHLFSLQRGHGSEQIPGATQRFPITDLGPDLHDFVDTAAAIKNLDLIVSCDTSIVHLAGAIGQTAWVALSYNADWRWLLNRADSPWYPTLRLFRQSVPGNWPLVFEEMARALKHFDPRTGARGASVELPRQGDGLTVLGATPGLQERAAMASVGASDCLGR